MKTMKDLRQEIIQTHADLKAGLVDLKVASEQNNSAGKIINTVRTQLEYSKLRKEKPQIDFLKCH